MVASAVRLYYAYHGMPPQPYQLAWIERDWIKDMGETQHKRKVKYTSTCWKMALYLLWIGPRPGRLYS